MFGGLFGRANPSDNLDESARKIQEMEKSVDDVMDLVATGLSDKECRKDFIPLLEKILSDEAIQCFGVGEVKSGGKKIIGNIVWPPNLLSLNSILGKINDIQKNRRKKNNQDTTLQDKWLIGGRGKQLVNDITNLINILSEEPKAGDPDLRPQCIATLLIHPQLEDIIGSMKDEPGNTFLKNKLTVLLSKALPKDGIIQQKVRTFGIDISVLDIQGCLEKAIEKLINNPKELTKFLKSMGETLKLQATITKHHESNLAKLKGNEEQAMQQLGLTSLKDAEGRILVKGKDNADKKAVIEKLLKLYGVEEHAPELSNSLKKIVEELLNNPKEINSFLNEAAEALKGRALMNVMVKADIELLEAAIDAGKEILDAAKTNIDTVIKLDEHKKQDDPKAPEMIADILLDLGIDPQEINNSDDLKFVTNKIIQILGLLRGDTALLCDIIKLYNKHEGNITEFLPKLLEEKGLDKIVEKLSPVVKDLVQYLGENSNKGNRLDSIGKVCSILGIHDRKWIEEKIKETRGVPNILVKMIDLINANDKIAPEIKDKIQKFDSYEKKRLELHIKRALSNRIGFSHDEYAAVFKSISSKAGKDNPALVEDLINNFAKLLGNEQTVELVKPLLGSLNRMLQAKDKAVEQEALIDLIYNAMGVVQKGNEVDVILKNALDILQATHDDIIIQNKEIPNKFINYMLGLVTQDIKLQGDAAKSILVLVKDLLETEFEVKEKVGDQVEVRKKNLFQIFHTDKNLINNLFKIIEANDKKPDVGKTLEEVKNSGQQELIEIFSEIMKGFKENEVINELMIEKGLMSQLVVLVIKSGILNHLSTENELLLKIFRNIDKILRNENGEQLVKGLISLFYKNFNVLAANNHVNIKQEPFLVLENKEQFISTLNDITKIIRQFQSGNDEEAKDALVGMLNTLMNIEPSIIRANDLNLDTFVNIVELGNLMSGVLVDPKNPKFAEKSLAKINELMTIATCPATPEGINNGNRGIKIGVLVMDLLSDKEVIAALNKAFIVQEKKNFFTRAFEKVFRPMRPLTEEGKKFKELMNELWNKDHSLRSFIVNPYFDFMNVIRLDQDQLVQFITDTSRAPKVFKRLKGVLEKQDNDPNVKKDKAAETKLVLTALNSANLVAIGGNAAIRYLYWHFRDKVVPFLSNLVVGNDINKQFKEFSLEAKNSTTISFDLATKMEKVADNIKNPWQNLWMGYRFKQRSLTKLTLKDVDFSNMVIDRFNFKEVKFKGGNFSNCLFNNCRFDDCYIDEKVTFENTKMDLMSARSLLKALGSNKYITKRTIDDILSKIEIVTTREQIDAIKSGGDTAKGCSLADLVNGYAVANKDKIAEASSKGSRDPKPTIYYRILGLFGYGPFALNKTDREELYDKQAIMKSLVGDIVDKLRYTSSQEFVSNVLEKATTKSAKPDVTKEVPQSQQSKTFAQRVEENRAQGNGNNRGI